MEADEFVCSVDKENKLGFYRLHSIWESNKLTLHIAANTASWKGEVTLDKLTEYCQNMPQKMTPEGYLEVCRVALSEGSPDMVYAIESGSFVWKKVLDADTGMKIKLGAIPVVNTNFAETIQNMLGVAITANQRLKQQVRQTDSERVDAETYVDKLFWELEQTKKTMESMENELMTQFVAILNIKKKKISELEEELIIAKAQGSASTVQNKPRKRKVKKEELKIDPYSEDTDEDMPGPSRSISNAQPNVVDLTFDSNQGTVLEKSIQTVQEAPHNEVIMADAASDPVDSDRGTFSESEKMTGVTPSNTGDSGVPPKRHYSSECTSTSPALLSKTMSNRIPTEEAAECAVSGQTPTAKSSASSKLVSNKPKDVLNFFFGDEESPKPNKSMGISEGTDVSHKSYDIMSQFF